MIARIFILIILATLLPDLYIYRRYIRHRFDLSLVMCLLWWVPGAAMVAVTLVYAMIDDFAPANLTLFNIYLFMLGLIVMPKLLFVLSSLAGRGVRRMTGGTRNWGNYKIWRYTNKENHDKLTHGLIKDIHHSHPQPRAAGGY